MMMSAYRNILSGFDFSTCSVSALKQAARLGGAMGAAVRAMHFLDPLVVTELQEALRGPATLPDELLVDVRRKWAEIAAGSPELGSLAFDAEIAHPVQGMLAAARTTAADLAIIGANSSAAGARRGAGTFATACIRKLPCDVMLVCERQVQPFQCILACIDFSDCSRLALERAVTLARLERARLLVLHVFDAPWHRLHYRAPTPEATPEFQRQYTDALQRRLDAFLEPLAGDLTGLSVDRQVIDHPHHGETIVELAGQAGVDLTVLGTRGRSRFVQMLLGSTAERVIRDAQSSLLAVRPAAV